MSPASGACAVVLVAVTAALTPALAWHGQAGHAPRAVAAARQAPAARTTSAQAAAARAAAGHPDIPVALAAHGQAAPQVPPAQPPPAAHDGEAAAGISSAGSLNWAGYAVSRARTRFNSVRATFFVPYLNCRVSAGGTKSSFWVGLDGYVNHPDSVEQIGIGADCSSAGKPSYFAWFEMFPFAQTKLSLTVRAGDSVTASVSYVASAKRFRLVLADNTRGGSVAKLRGCPGVKVNGKAVTCPRTSAEVIAEAPATGFGRHLVIDHLSDYGALSFTGIAITNSAGQRGGISSRHWSATKIIQVRTTDGPTIAQPTPVQGTMFDCYWLRED